MNNPIVFYLIVIAALGAGTIGGVFFGFSAFVMKALARLPPAQGIAAMQSINTEAPTAKFLIGFLGTAAVSGVIAVVALINHSVHGATASLIGAGLYLIGNIVVTAAFNIPLNKWLDTVQPQSANAPQAWATYVKRWTAWNHVRTATAIGAMGAFITAITP